MDTLVTALYHLSTALLLPVVAALLALLAWVVFEIGGFLHEWRIRLRTQGSWNAFIDLLGRDEIDLHRARGLLFQSADRPGLVAAFVRRGRPFRDNAVELERILSEVEIDGKEACSRMNLWVRIGPMLGLMGTLIPMGPALMALSAANMEAMADSLVVAFSTTVAGLLIGAFCLVMSVSRRHWYARDLVRIEHIVTKLYPQSEEPWKANGIRGGHDPVLVR